MNPSTGATQRLDPSSLLTQFTEANETALYARVRLIEAQNALLRAMREQIGVQRVLLADYTKLRAEAETQQVALPAALLDFMQELEARPNANPND